MLVWAFSDTDSGSDGGRTVGGFLLLRLIVTVSTAHASATQQQHNEADEQREEDAEYEAHEEAEHRVTVLGPLLKIIAKYSPDVVVTVIN